jgi:hypothetical protein
MTTLSCNLFDTQGVLHLYSSDLSFVYLHTSENATHDLPGILTFFQSFVDVAAVIRGLYI